MLRRLILYAVLLLAVTGGVSWFLFFSKGIVLGPAASIINNAESIEVFRLARDDFHIYFPPPQAAPQDGFFENVPLIATARIDSLGPSYQQRAASAIKDAMVVDPKKMSTCTLKPGIAFRFTRKSETATIFLCYYCSDGFVLVRNSSGASTYTRKYHFIKSNQALLKVIQEAFPTDPGIAKLVAASGELPDSRPAD